MKQAGKIWTVIDIVRWGAEYFKDKGIDSPRLTIELMLCNVMNIDRIGIYTQFEKPLQPAELDRLREMVARRVKREPLQYITGSTNFFGLNIELDKSVLIPRPETEMLVETVLNDTKDSNKNYNILDIGSGSGCISLALAKHLPGSVVTALDVSGEALEQAERNAELNFIENIKFKKLNILEDIPSGQKFELVVSNPPYISIKDYNELEPEVLRYEPADALTDRSDGLTFYRRFAGIIKDIMTADGAMYLEFGFGQSGDIKKIFEDSGMRIDIIKDLSGIDRIARMRR